MLAAFSAAACKSQSPADEAARHINQANSSLQGDWTLVDYRPEVPLEPIMSQILSVQIGHLVVHFDGANAIAQGVGLQARRTYRIKDSDGVRSTIDFFDESGVSYEVAATVQGNQLSFSAFTPPWRGLGTLQRGAPIP
jgi:hypothetical protein